MSKSSILWLGTLGVLVAGLGIDRYSTNLQLKNLEHKYNAMLETAAARSTNDEDAQQDPESLAQASNEVPAPPYASAPVPSASQPTSAGALAGSPESEPPSPQDHMAFIEGVFSGEHQDQAWARGAENKLNGALLPFAVGGSRIHHVECRSTLCNVRVEHATEGGFQDFARHLAQPGYWRGAMLSMREPDGNRGTVANVMYFSREGYAMPNMPD